MKGKIWILIVILLIAAIGVGAGAGIWISNGINQKEQQEAAEDRDNRIEPIESEKLAEESSEKGCTEESKNTSIPSGLDIQEENVKAHAAYADILTYIHDHPTEFVEGFTDDPVADVEYNTFAVADISDDGIDELIVVFTNTFMAGQYSRIYTWDAAAQQATDYVFMVGAYCSFYHGEIVQEFASHNQGPSSLWPYAVFWYDAEVQAYQYAFSASSVDESLDPNHNEYKPENDVDGDGVIYYIYKPNHDYSKDPEPLTYDAFQHYVDAYIPEQNLIEMTYVTLTMENINALR
ncbi:MAG: hypothetical protein IIY45_14265 [Firmicutes bacterium]|nr:hypothetical protein [Bacillota bacterium]